MHFVDRLFTAIRRVGNPVLVGIDPRPEELPPGFLELFPANREGVSEALHRFGRDVIDVVAPLVAAVKFQSAFYEAYGPSGVAAIHSTAAYAHEKGLIVIIDGKRNDIGSTAEAYARGYLGKVPIGGSFEPSWQADALTVNPYLGTDGVTPFVKVAAREHKGVFVVVRTSNSSAGEFQDLVADGKPLYRHVAERSSGGPIHTGAKQDIAWSGRSSARPTPNNWPSSGRYSPASCFSFPATASRAHLPAKSPGLLTPTAWERSSITPGESPTHTSARPTMPGSATTGRPPLLRRVRDMIDDLAANTSAGKLRDAASAVH